MNAQVWIAVLIGLAATINDLARREISNWIPAAALVCGTAWQMSQRGWWGALNALAGAAAGFAVFLVFYLLGGMGGGDVKLMSGFGALLGPGRLVEAALWTAGVGGVLALATLGFRALRRSWVGVRSGTAQAASDSIPYAPAITLGVWLSLVPKG
ncbi:MAG TPA: prepilin peptidase [Bryobacteraceae bacterium]|nr:prepilin peptidase [Bryobacteraceae bacterium]